MTDRLQWPPIIARAAEIVDGYSISVTLRQLFYRLVAEQLLPNEQPKYKQLSARTAKLRRFGDFPALADRGRGWEQPAAWAGPSAALRALAGQYRVDRTADQDMSLWVAVEKNALAGLLGDWFGELGVPVLPLSGYSSESLDTAVSRQVRRDGRPAVLIYAGDFDASGMDIGRNFVRQTDCWHTVTRVALSEEQVLGMGLPVNPGKPRDSRSARFRAEHPAIHAAYGGPVQIELDAVDPEVLRGLYQGEIDRHVDMSRFEARKAQEEVDVARLRAIAAAEGA